jgi:beta-lactamase class A
MLCRSRGAALALFILVGAIAISATGARSAPARPVRAAPGSGPVSSWRPDISAARRYANHRRGRIAFDVIDAAGRERGVHPTRSFPMASVFKVMLLATYLRRPSVAHRRLHRPERRLLVPMIRRSDSTAATRVRDIVGPSAIRRLARAAGMRRYRYNPVWGLSRTTPRDQARFMDHLDRFVPARHRAFARHQLAHIVHSQRWGIGRLRLPGWRLYFKGGWGSGSGAVDHQVAFIESGSARIALAIFTQSDGSHHYGKRTLRGIAARLLRDLPRAGFAT